MEDLAFKRKENYRKNEESRIEISEEGILKDDEEKTGDSKRLQMRESIINHLSIYNSVVFKNLNEAENELCLEKKLEMAANLLDNDYGVFLVKFGKYLKQQHLPYFENRNEEDALIVDIHLTQLNKMLEKTDKSIHVKQEKLQPVAMEVSISTEASSAEQSRINLRTRLLDHLSLSTNAHFRNQQIGEPDLEPQEKREIAEHILNRSFSLFLGKFGNHLLEEHLDYFDDVPDEENYEVNFHLKRLRKNHCKSVSKVGIKNRRFEALKKMVKEGSYFSEVEMQNRNPLLYEELVGKFLTTEERRERINNIDTTNITLVNLLIEKMDREAVKKLKKEQEDAENIVMEEEEDSCNEKMESEIDSEEDNELDKTMWGENYSDCGPSVSANAIRKKEKRQKEVTAKVKASEDVPELEESEKYLLMQEFRSNMFSNFLLGKDTDFDYSKVDYNSDYDDLEAEGYDEEEKYFDEESSEEINSSMKNGKLSDNETEDVLDQFMSKLHPEPTTHQLTERLQGLTHKDTETKS